MANTFQAPELIDIVEDDIDIFTPRVYNNLEARKPTPDAVF